jgi:hypothetical protein
VRIIAALFPITLFREQIRVLYTGLHGGGIDGFYAWVCKAQSSLPQCPVLLTGEDARVLRGGSWDDFADGARCANHVRYADTWGLREHVFASQAIPGGRSRAVLPDQ